MGLLRRRAGQRALHGGEPPLRIEEWDSDDEAARRKARKAKASKAKKGKGRKGAESLSMLRMEDDPVAGIPL